MPMDRIAIENAKRITPALFGDTDIAGGIPHEHRPSPSNGPVYFEGQLVLALSFQGDEFTECTGDGEAIDELRLWDVLSDSWFGPSPVILRYGTCDLVLADGKPVFRGVVKSEEDVTLVPGWDSICTAVNNQYYLRWKSLRRKSSCSER